MSFDGTSIVSEAVIPISTVAQQIDVMAKEAIAAGYADGREKKRKPIPLKSPIHKVVVPEVLTRETTG